MVLTGIGATGDCVLMIQRGLSQSPTTSLDCCPATARVIIVTDREVAALHAPALAATLAAAGRTVHTVVVDGSEAAKNLEGVRSIYEQLSDIDCSQGDLILAFGGGSIIDMASFAATTFLGGIPLVVMPTSLAAMVDSSVSHNCCLNFRSTRNVIQAVSRPLRVLIDPDYLNSLSQRQMANGYAQIIRYGMISDPELISMMIGGQPDMEVLIGRAIEARLKTERDNPDSLEFGRSVGDAIEGHFRFLKYQHGEALALGMLAACPPPQLRSLLQQYNLPLKLEGVTPDTIIRRIVKSLQIQGPRGHGLVRVEEAGKPFREMLDPAQAELRMAEIIAILTTPA